MRNLDLLPGGEVSAEPRHDPPSLSLAEDLTGHLAKDPEGVLHVGGTQHLAHRAEMRQTRGAEAAFEDYCPLGRVAADPLGKPACLFIRPKVQFRSLSHQSYRRSNLAGVIFCP